MKTKIKVIGILMVLVCSIFFATSAFAVTSRIQHLPNGALVFTVYGPGGDIGAVYMFDGKTGKLLKESINKGVVKIQEFDFGNLYKSVKFLNKDGSLGAKLDIRTQYSPDGTSMRQTTLDMVIDPKGNVLERLVIENVFDKSGKLVNCEVSNIHIEYDSNNRATHSVEEIYKSLAMKESDLLYVTDTRYTKYDSQGRVLRMTKITVSGGKTTTETDAADRVYDAQGRLIHSTQTVTGSGPGLNRTYAVESAINPGSAEQNIAQPGEIPAGLAIQDASVSPLPKGIAISGTRAGTNNNFKSSNP